MGVTTVVRGEEYISSTPVHLEIIDALGFERFKYCHNPLICKIPENGNKRKISKRYDPEADMRFYFEKGYPNEAVLEYLLNLISSSFEGWRKDNPNAKWSDFKFGINDITAVSPIFDMVKLNDMSKNIVAKMTAEELYDKVLAWTKEYNTDFAKILESDKDYAVQIFSIDRGGEKPRKDIYCYSMIPEYYSYFFDDYKTLDFEIDALNKDKELICNIFNKYANEFDGSITKEEWFNSVKNMATEFNFCTDNKQYKLDPTKYNGNTATFCNILRVCITGRQNSPDLYSICKVLGKEELQTRAQKLKSML